MVLQSIQSLRYYQLLPIRIIAKAGNNNANLE